MAIAGIFPFADWLNLHSRCLTSLCWTTFLFPSFVTFYTVFSHGCQPFKGVGYVCSCTQLGPVLTRRHAGKIFGNKEMRLLMLGLDAAGKTSEHRAYTAEDCLASRV